MMVMRLIDADRLLSEPMKNKYYHLKNGDTAVPLIDIKNAPIVDAVPVAWIEDEIKEMNEMDNPFSTLTANLLSAMLRRWKEREGNG